MLNEIFGMYLSDLHLGTAVNVFTNSPTETIAYLAGAHFRGCFTVDDQSKIHDYLADDDDDDLRDCE